MALGFFVVALSFVAGWIPDGLAALIWEDEKGKALFMLAVGLITLFFLLLLGRFLVSARRYEVVQDKPSKRKALILFLSKAAKLNEESWRKLQNSLFLAESREEKMELINSKESPVRSWTMPVKAVEYHLPKLETVYVVGSKDSSPQIGYFRELLQSLFPEATLSIREREVSSFEDFEELQSSLEKIYEELKGEGYKEKETILDITGGQKLVSIVGALLSLYSGREFQYVSTNDYSVKSYDVEARE